MQDLWGLKGTKRVWAPEEVSNFGKLGWDSQFWGLWPQLHHQERLQWQDNHCDLAESMLSILIEEICQTKWKCALHVVLGGAPMGLLRVALRVAAEQLPELAHLGGEGQLVLWAGYRRVGW